MPSSLHAQITRRAISPRLAMRIFLNINSVELDHTDGDARAPLKLGLEDAGVPVHAQTHFFGRIANNSCPYSIGWPFLTRHFTISPPTSASISFISFIASTMQSTWPSSTASPGLTNGGDPGEGDS